MTNSAKRAWYLFISTWNNVSGPTSRTTRADPVWLSTKRQRRRHRDGHGEKRRKSVRDGGRDRYGPVPVLDRVPVRSPRLGSPGRPPARRRAYRRYRKLIGGGRTDRSMQYRRSVGRSIAGAHKLLSKTLAHNFTELIWRLSAICNRFEQLASGRRRLPAGCMQIAARLSTSMPRPSRERSIQGQIWRGFRGVKPLELTVYI